MTENQYNVGYSIDIIHKNQKVSSKLVKMTIFPYN